MLRIFLLSVISGSSNLSFTVALEVGISCLQSLWGKGQHTGECDFNSASQG